jgi:hypothetical protein
MDKPAISYVPRGDATPEAELNTLAGIYALALQRHREKHEDVPDRRPDDATVRNKEGVSHVDRQPN